MKSGASSGLCTAWHDRYKDKAGNHGVLALVHGGIGVLLYWVMHEEEH